MDPDGQTFNIILIAVCAAMLFALSFYIGAAAQSDYEKQKRTRLGFSDVLAAAVLLFAVCTAGFTFALSNLVANAWLWLAILLVAVMLFAFLPLALGLATSEKAYGPLSNALAIFLLPLRYTVVPLLLLPVKLIFLGSGTSAQDEFTAEDVLELVDSVEEQQIIDGAQKEMISNIFELDDLTAGEVMTHRTEVVAVEQNESAQNIIALALEEGFSRLPVYAKTLDNVVGIVHVKDLLGLAGDGHESVTARDLMRAAMFVPEACGVRELLVDFKRKHTQIAVVVDEYGGTSGIVSMEDVLEEIVGSIQDEFDDEEDVFVKQSDGTYICDGSAPIEDVYQLFGLDVPDEIEQHDFESISGFITSTLGRIPEDDEDVELPLGGVVFNVLGVGERRIHKVRCSIVVPQQNGQ